MQGMLGMQAKYSIAAIFFSGYIHAVADKPKSRIGKKAVQVFVEPLALIRFRAACAFVDRDQSDVLEAFMVDFANGVGIPATPGNPDHSHKPSPKPKPR
jgi:hypothetical protein